MLRLTCVGCSKEFSITSDYTEPGEIEGCTFDCPNCELLLVMNDGVVKDFHKMLHEDMPEWPEDGAGTGVISF